MADRPYTDVELEAGAEAVAASLGRPRPHSPHDLAGAVLDAVLPDHDARVRADERAQVAEQLLAGIEAMRLVAQHPHAAGAYRNVASVIREHLTPPTTKEEDHHAA